MATRRDWGVPDWSKQSGYSSLNDDTPPSGWTWEFLRRNHAYRDFWAEKIEPYVSDGGFIYRNSYGERWPYHDELRSRFGVDLPSEPNSPVSSIFVTGWMKSIGYDCSDEGEIRAIIAKNELAIIFDLDRSLADQIKYAHKLLIERKQYRPKQRPAARLRTDKYITYLRILDAIDADPSPKQTDVAAALFPKIDDFGTGSPRMKLYYKQRKAAIDLRDKDYGALIEFFRGRAPE